MPDEISSGDTAEVVAPVSGDATGSTEVTTANPVETGTAVQASVSEELPEGLRDKYVPVDRYQNLESKLGNWSETEKAAALYAQLSQDPRVQAALAPQPEPQVAEQIPDFSTMQPQDVIGWLDKRSESQAQKLFDTKMSEYEGKNIKPLQEAVFNRQANESIQALEAKYPDFKENRQAIAELLDKVPALAESKEGLEMAYRNVTWEKQQAEGAKEAVKKLQTKSKDTSVKPQGSAPSGKAKPITIADAWAQAEEEAAQ